MEIKRDQYVEKLFAHRWNGMVKIITGVRRCGKSYLLFNLFYRKYGKFTERIGNLIGFSRIGRWGRRLAYRVK